MVLMASLLAGCGAVDRMAADFTGWSVVCVDGVAYLQFPSGVTVKVDRAGRPVGCE